MGHTRNGREAKLRRRQSAKDRETTSRQFAQYYESLSSEERLIAISSS